MLGGGGVGQFNIKHIKEQGNCGEPSFPLNLFVHHTEPWFTYKRPYIQSLRPFVCHGQSCLIWLAVAQVVIFLI